MSSLSSGQSPEFCLDILIVALDSQEKAMKTLTFVKRTHLPVSAEDLFRFHAEPDAFERLSPPWENVEVVSRTHEGLVEGSRLTIRLGGFPGGTWVAEITDVCEGRGFRDVMVTGPFARWEHRHRFLPDGPRASILEDRIEYALPLGFLGRLFGAGFVRRRLSKMFAWRHDATARILAGNREGTTTSALVLIALGSRDPSWRRTFDELCRDLGGDEAGQGVRLAFLQFDRPTLAEAVEDCAAAGAKKIRVLPLFLATGGHVNREIPAAVEEIRTARPDLELDLLPSLGEHPRILDALADTARAARWES
jgi:ligand-binding SRPBCC domain-containing protein